MPGNPNFEEAMKMLARRQKRKKETHYLELEPSERALLTSAATIYAAYLQSGRAGEEDDEALMDRAIQDAIVLASKVDTIITDAEEVRER